MSAKVRWTAAIVGLLLANLIAMILLARAHGDDCWGAGSNVI